MDTRRPKVLIVENDDSAALSFYRALYLECDRCDVLLARTVSIARGILRELSVSVLVLDSTLPGRGSADLLQWTSEHSPDTAIVLIAEVAANDGLEMMVESGLVQTLPKPVDLQQLSSVVRRCVESEGAFRGRLSALSIPDLLQMLCQGAKSTAVVVQAGETTGVVLIERGSLVHAQWGQHVGERALLPMVSLEEGSFRLSPLPSEFKTTIARNWQHVLLDALRALDEENRDRTEAPAAPDQPELDVVEGRGWTLVPPPMPTEASRSQSEVRELSEPFDADPAMLVDQGFAALREGHPCDARRYWIQALRLDPANRTLELNLRRLDEKLIRAS